MQLEWQQARARASHPQDGVRRPPGTVERRQLAETCCGCGDCVAVCPSGALELDTLGYPCVTSVGGRCEQCGLCADVCTRGAIVYTPAMLRARERALAIDGGAVLCAEDLRAEEPLGTI